ncbi:MAG: DNA polymerase III subunit delta [Pirellulales bacterium]|nr:DNA polymerase III subunit delta [Pirellulales bacterium]
MAGALHALDFLSDTPDLSTCSMLAIVGDEPFLARQVALRLRQTVLSGGDAEFSLATFDGREAQLSDVFDELQTVALFGGGRRLVIVETADDFVTQHRAALEDFVERPHPTGVLALAVRSMPSNTRLYKAVLRVGLIVEATVPATPRLKKWLGVWSQQAHGKSLEPAAADLLLELVGPELGLLDQELAKLAASLGDEARITGELVADLVGGWRAKTTWEMLDTAAAGDAASAIGQLDRLLLGGENPIGLLAQISSSLRRYAAATRVVNEAERRGQRANLRAALEQAGIKSFLLGKAEGQLRQIGRQRGERLYRLLLDADLALKGASAAPPRLVLEQLIVRLSKQAAPAKAAATGR